MIDLAISTWFLRFLDSYLTSFTRELIIIAGSAAVAFFIIVDHSFYFTCGFRKLNMHTFQET